jgi:hypothetical protein
MKRRSITIGKEQVAELMVRLDKKRRRIVGPKLFFCMAIPTHEGD